MENLDNVMMTKKRFQSMVEETVLKYGLTHMDAILMLCEKNSIEPEDIAKYMTPVIKDKLEADAMRLNFLVGSNDYLPLE